MKVTTTITIEIKAAKHELTRDEAFALLNALQAALGPQHTYAPNDMKSIFDKAKQDRDDRPFPNRLMVGA